MESRLEEKRNDPAAGLLVSTIRGQVLIPTALRIGPYRFYFYSYDCAERRHMHVDRENRSAKFWIDPVVTLADNHGYGRRELREIERIAGDNLETLRNEWDRFCSGSDA